MSNVTAIRADLLTAPAEAEVFLSPAQVAELVPGLSVRTLREWRAAKRNLPFVQLSEKRVAYFESDVRAWMASHRTTVRNVS